MNEGKEEDRCVVVGEKARKEGLYVHKKRKPQNMIQLNTYHRKINPFFMEPMGARR